MNSQEWLKLLISFNTISRNSNLELIHTIQNWLADHQIASNLTYDAHQQKANLFATLPYVNHDSAQGLILSGHTDVVPVEGQKWQSDPFQALEKDGCIYGRG